MRAQGSVRGKIPSVPGTGEAAIPIARQYESELTTSPPARLPSAL